MHKSLLDTLAAYRELGTIVTHTIMNSPNIYSYLTKSTLGGLIHYGYPTP